MMFSRERVETQFENRERIIFFVFLFHLGTATIGPRVKEQALDQFNRSAITTKGRARRNPEKAERERHND